MRSHGFLRFFKAVTISPIKLIVIGIYNLLKVAGALIFTATIILCLINIFLGHFELSLIMFFIALVLFLFAKTLVSLK